LPETDLFSSQSRAYKAASNRRAQHHALSDAMDDATHRKRLPPIHRISYKWLLVVPIILAIGTGFALFLRADVNVAMLYSQCHSRARLDFLSRLPVIGAPTCFLVSFFQEALTGLRAQAIMAEILAFVGGLLTVSLVEAARICNAPNVLIAYPTGPWLVFNLIGGAIVWELLIIPAFLHRSQQLLRARRDHVPVAVADEESIGRSGRHLAVDVEALAIPLGVAVGFMVPSVLMLVLDNPAAILVWLFFPAIVSVVRQLARDGSRLVRARGESLHLESHRVALAVMYSVPILCSAMAHGFLIWSLVAGNDDRQQMTRSTLHFIEVDVAFIAATVLYWLLVEAGWRLMMVVVGVSVLLGPGAGICIGWIWRERHFGTNLHVTVVAVGSQQEDDGGEAGEHTPLLR
jgi:hypothetical protein